MDIDRLSVPEAFASWRRVEPLIEPALAHLGGRFAPIDILAEIASGDMQLWRIGQPEPVAAIVTEIVDYPRKRACRVLLVGGFGLRAWRAPLLAALDAFARDHGCDLLEGGGRMGWARAAGFRVNGVHLEKEVSIHG